MSQVNILDTEFLKQLDKDIRAKGIDYKKYRSMQYYLHVPNNSFNQNLLTVPREKVKYRPVKGGKFKGFTLYLRDIFQELNIEHNSYYKSCELIVDGKSYNLFQHQSKNAKNNWFYFGIEFKSRNFKSFLNKTKKFLIDKIGEEMAVLWDSALAKLEGKYSDLLEDYDEIVEKETGIPNNFVRTKLIIDKNTYTFKFKNMVVRMTRGVSVIQFFILDKIFNKNKELAEEFIKELVSEMGFLFPDEKFLSIKVIPRPHIL